MNYCNVALLIYRQVLRERGSVCQVSIGLRESTITLTDLTLSLEKKKLKTYFKNKKMKMIRELPQMVRSHPYKLLPKEMTTVQKLKWGRHV